MFSSARLRLTPFLLVLSVLLMLFLSGTGADSAAAKNGRRWSVVSTEFIGMVTFDTGTMFAGTEVGGLSGITYDDKNDVYYALSDDRSQINPARFYTVDIDLSDGHLDAGDITFLDVTFLTDESGATFAPFSVDPEEIVMTHKNEIYVSTEGDSNSSPPIDPFVNRFDAAGMQNRALPVPDKFLPDGLETFGIRDNLAFEAMTATDNRRFLYVATENALYQDGPQTTLTGGSPSRFLEYSLKEGITGREWVYVVNPIPKDSDPPGGYADMGLVAINVLDKDVFLTMERSFAVGQGNTILLFEASAAGATDVSGYDALDPVGGAPVPYASMSKRLVLDVSDLGISPDNLEAMTFGPKLADNRWPLILVSDNNFNPGQITQFVVVAVELAKVHPN